MSAGSRRGLRLAFLTGCLLAALVPARAGAVALQPVGTFAAPIFVTAPPGDGRLFVVERGGTIRVVKSGVTQATPFLDISALTTVDGERGLLSMAFDPNFASNGLFYVDYTGDGPNSGGTLGDIHIDEFKVSTNPDVADPLSRRPVLVVNRPSTVASNHNGGQLQFGPDGMLYISVGDGGTGGALAQDPNSLNGKLLRVDPHQTGADPYTIPASNPFVGVDGADEVWSLGLRNPFRFSFDRLDGSLTIGDVGQSAHEEIDYRPQSTGGGRGANFGWPCREGFSPLTACMGTFTDPIFDYPHADPGGDSAYGCSIIGGYVYRGSDVPELAGRYVYADLCTSVLRSIAPGLPLGSGDRSETAAILANPVSFGEDSRCELYVAAGSYTVSKIVSNPGAQSGMGGCAAPPPPPPPPPSPLPPQALPLATRPPLALKLSTARRAVPRGRKVLLKARAEPCLGTGEQVQLFRENHVIKARNISTDCQVKFRVRIRHRSRFSAAIAESPSHLAATSDPVRVKATHKH